MPGKRWSSSETRALQRAWDEYGQPSAIRLRGRTANSIKRKLVREGLLDVQREGRLPWSQAEVEQLERYVREGLTAREVHRDHLSERSYHSIAQKISRMKLLAGEGRSQQLRDCRRLEGEELAEFEEAVATLGKSRHTAWFVWKFAVGRGKVKRALRARGEDVSWRDAMQLPQTKQRFASRVSHASAGAWERRRAAMKADMVERLHEMQDEVAADPKLGAESNYQIRQCVGCKAEWFADGAFFKASFKRLPGGGRKRYLQRSCRICTSGQRGASAKERILEGQQRDAWRSVLSLFDETMMHTHPEFYRDPVEGLAIRWEPFIDLLEGRTTPEIMALLESVVKIYAESKVSDVLDRLEESCFDGEAELHFDVWDLDERLRCPAKERPALVRDGRLLPAGRKLAIRLYRVVRLAEYAKSLV